MTRHSKNELRNLKATVEDVERVIANPIRVDYDSDERSRYTGYIRDVRVRIVVALDEPDLVVTIHKRRR